MRVLGYLQRDEVSLSSIGKLGLLILLLTALVFQQPHSAIAAGSPALSGRIMDNQGQPVQGAEIFLYPTRGGKPWARTTTNQDGIFLLDISKPPTGGFQLKVSHPHFHDQTWEPDEKDVEILKEGGSLRVPDIELERKITLGFWIATFTFLLVLGLIITESMHSTIAALLGAGLMLLVSMVGGRMAEGLFIFGFDRAIHYVDFNVIFLVFGMMIIISIIERTGIFQWISYHAYRFSGGRLWLLAMILMLFTSLASALLDNVTTMLLVTPISIQIALALGVDPLSLVIPEMLASNVGGIATLIGTPNNILIGSYAGLTFNDFLRNLTPGVLLIQLVLTLYVLVVFRPAYQESEVTGSDDLLELLEKNAQIRQPETLRKSGLVFLGTLILFVVGEHLHLLPAVTAMIGAAVTLVVVNIEVEEVFRVIDWSTLLFFMALFMIVGAIREVGLISVIASGIHRLVAGDLFAAILAVIWGTGFLCLLIPTIPLTAALLPVVGFLEGNIPAASGHVLFYSLSVGSALGANNSLIGATNNMVTAGITKRAGYPIRYRTFIKYGFPAAVLTMTVGTLYILWRF